MLSFREFSGLCLRRQLLQFPVERFLLSVISADMVEPRLFVTVRDFSNDIVSLCCQGTSDPYVLFRIGGKLFYRSRTVYKNLSPRWDERFSLPVEDPFKPIVVSVFDYDRGMNDDFMGSANILSTQLDIDVSVHEDH